MWRKLAEQVERKYRCDVRSEPRLPSRFSQYQSPQSLVELLYWSDDRLSFRSGRKPARGF